MRVRRGALCAVLLVCLHFAFLPAQSTSTKTTEAEPYSADEFPQWARDLRRAEVVAFGALPFALFFSKTAVDTYRFSRNDWDRRYAPWPLKTAGAVSMTESEFKTTFAAACVGALTVALADFIIVKIKRYGERKAVEERPKAFFEIERSGSPSSASVETGEED